MRSRQVAILACLAIALVGCAPAAAFVSQQDAGVQPEGTQRTLVIAIRGEMPSVASRPLVPVTGALAPPTMLFNAALDCVDERGNPHPFLAEALPVVGTDTWRVLADGRMETTYRLKPDLTWHDGMPLSADDFVFAWWVYSTPELGVSSTPPVGQMEEIVAPDPRTLVIRWRQTYGDAGVLQGDFPPLPRHILGDALLQLDPGAFAALPFWTQEYVGLGPYRITTWEPGAYVDGAAFGEYVFGRPRIERVRLQVFSDPNAAMAGLLSERVHFVSDYVLSETEGDTLEERWADNHAGTVLYAPVELRFTVIQLRPDYADPSALLDVRVRRALAHAIDNAAAVEVLTAGKGLATSTLSSPAVDYYPEIERLIARHLFDPSQAQRLLEEAGFTRKTGGLYADRNGAPLSIGVWSTSGAKNERENALYVDNLRQAGIKAVANIFSAQQLRDAQARALIPGLSVRGFGQKRLETFTSDRVTGPENRWHGDNRGGWANATYDRLFAAYANSMDPEQRIKHIARMERVFSEDVPGIPHFFGATVNAHVAALQGPVARVTPEAGIGYLNVQKWQWRS